MKYLLISLLILILGLVGALSPIRSGVSWMASPIQLGLREVAFHLRDGAFFVTRFAKIDRQNKELTEKVVTLQAEISELKKVREENAFLKEQLGLENQQLEESHFLVANVMGNPNDLTQATVFLDKGSKQGVHVDDIVIFANHLVGKVTTVTATKSLVDLVTSPNISVTVLDIDTSTSVEGVVVGKHGVSMEMLRILPGESVGVGDTIVASGKDGIFMPGLIVGEVVNVIEVPTEPLKSAQLESLLDLASLRKVLVVLSE